MSLTVEQIKAVLHTITDQQTQKSIGQYVKDRDIVIEADRVHVALTLGYPITLSQQSALQDAIYDALKAIPVSHAAPAIDVAVTWKIAVHAVQRGLTPLPNVANIIAVASGKGGVGKSTVAVNIALALMQDGARVGILDADIYGPSIPTMLGISGQPPVSHDNKTMAPMQGHGLQVNSIGFLIDAESPAIWRGPMVTQALGQLLRQTNWHALDYLIVDMPPGTGDIALTLAQKVPVVGAVIVTTPQDIALLDARRGLRMFEKLTVPILGVVENMSHYQCSHCGHTEAIFGQGGGHRMAEQAGVPWLGALPLMLKIREHADSGYPTVVAEPDSMAARQYHTIARQLAQAVARLPRDMRHKFPPIVVQPT